MWPELIAGCQKGEQILDPAFVEEVHQRLAHLCSDTVESGTNGILHSLSSNCFNIDNITRPIVLR